jgi:hypothetical protein
MFNKDCILCLIVSLILFSIGSAYAEPMPIFTWTESSETFFIPKMYLCGETLFAMVLANPQIDALFYINLASEPAVKIAETDFAWLRIDPLTADSLLQFTGSGMGIYSYKSNKYIWHQMVGDLVIMPNIPFFYYNSNTNAYLPAVFDREASRINVYRLENPFAEIEIDCPLENYEVLLVRRINSLLYIQLSMPDLSESAIYTFNVNTLQWTQILPPTPYFSDFYPLENGFAYLIDQNIQKKFKGFNKLNYLNSVKLQTDGKEAITFENCLGWPNKIILPEKWIVSSFVMKDNCIYVADEDSRTIYKILSDDAITSANITSWRDIKIGK